jgi:indolepyruvate ferredoxin oxidoreductase, beta subunit
MAWLSLWLDHIARALDIAPNAAVEIAETAKLVRGYGSTYALWLAQLAAHRGAR